MKMQCLLAVVFFSASLAYGQTPTPFLKDLPLKLRMGEKVEVIDINGKKTQGKFDGASEASLGLIAHGARQEFLESQIREVRKQRSDSRWDGVLIGLGIGAAAGVVNIESICRSASERRDCFGVGWSIILPIYAGGGAGTGALIDFAIRKHDTVFAPAAPGYRFRVSPVLGKQQKGVALSLSF